MHTHPTLADLDETERHLRVARVLLERAIDDLEDLERDAAGEHRDQLANVAMTVALAYEELPAV